MKDRITKTENIIWRKIDNEIAVIMESGRSLHVLNETAGYIMEMCDGEHDPDEIAAGLCERFEVTIEEAKTDVYNTITELENLGILKRERREDKQ